MRFWLLAGSQTMYGPKTIAQVEENCRAMAGHWEGLLPYPLEYKGLVISHETAKELALAANYDGGCAGVVTF